MNVCGAVGDADGVCVDVVVAGVVVVVDVVYIDYGDGVGDVGVVGGGYWMVGWMVGWLV